MTPTKTRPHNWLNGLVKFSLSLVWQKDQKAVCHCLTDILDLADGPNQDTSS